jgi:GNAT superfamily N-acetyltransferase
MNSDDRFHIRVMEPHDITLAIEWAAAEGWNPGHADAACFATVDAQGFLLGTCDGKAAATISTVNYDARFAFLGFYIVRPDLRGRGLGLRIWNAAIAHAGPRTIGLDGVVAQQENYKKSGFVLAYRNIRFGGVPERPAREPPGILPLTAVPFAAIAADDARVFPAPREAFLRSWINASGHVGRALMRDGRLAGWGVIRPCRRGHKIGPLIAADRAAAESVFASLVAAAGGEVFLDVPERNRDAVALAQAHGLAPVFETARMYTGPVPAVALERVFGVTTFELG